MLRQSYTQLEPDTDNYHTQGQTLGSFVLDLDTGTQAYIAIDLETQTAIHMARHKHRLGNWIYSHTHRH